MSRANRTGASTIKAETDPRRAKAYVAVVTAATLAFVVYLATRYSIPIGLTIGFGVLCFLAEQYPVTFMDRTGHSVGFVITMAAIVATGPASAAIAASFGGLSLRRVGGSRTSGTRQIFNAAQFAMTTGVAGLVYAAAGGSIHTVEGMFPWLLVPVFLATMANFAVNTALVLPMIVLVTGRGLRELWQNVRILSMTAAHLAFALLGVLFAILNLQMGWAAILFLLVPLLVARNTFQASAQMFQSYEATVRSLITAIEKKDAYTRGHAERVARLAEMTANQLGLSPEKARVVRFAALMHDVGKLGVATRILQKPGKLTVDEYEHMKQHPIRGHEIVGEIDFLTDAVLAVRHHHEKLDGSGYPDGLQGEQIPLLARIITVADAFDSMTSTRVYRKAKSFEEAFAELHRCEGTQFDSACLAALEAAVQRRGWEAFPEADEQDEEVQARAASV